MCTPLGNNILAHFSCGTRLYLVPCYKVLHNRTDRHRRQELHLSINHKDYSIRESTRNNNSFNEIIILEYRVPDH